MTEDEQMKGGLPERIPGTTYPRKAEDENQSASSLGRIMLFAGSASGELGEEIAAELNVPLGRYTRTIFPNENIFIQLQESVRGQDVYVVYSIGSPIHEHMFQLLLMIDTLKRDSAGRINVVLPYYPYARSDKKDQPRVGIAARLFANLIEVAGADRYITIDLHAGQIQGFFNIPGDALKAFHLMSDYVRIKNIPDLVVVATDLGFAKKGRDWAEKLGTQLGIFEKRRRCVARGSSVWYTRCPKPAIFSLRASLARTTSSARSSGASLPIAGRSPSMFR